MTYPLYVNAAVKAAVPPQINVLATAILVISLILLAAGTLLRRKRFADYSVTVTDTRPCASRSATAWPVRS